MTAPELRHNFVASTMQLQNGKFVAQVIHNIEGQFPPPEHTYQVGIFDTVEEAIKAANNAVPQYAADFDL